jgi:hypothetical protein
MHADGAALETSPRRHLEHRPMTIRTIASWLAWFALSIARLATVRALALPPLPRRARRS